LVELSGSVVARPERVQVVLEEALLDERLVLAFRRRGLRAIILPTRSAATGRCTSPATSLSFASG
jgi:hypothetical protein